MVVPKILRYIRDLGVYIKINAAVVTEVRLTMIITPWKLGISS